jgi:V/A-type H+-transporting ATPase subunit K
MAIGTILAILGSALAVILAGIGSALGVRKVGEVGAGLISEEPEKFGRVLLLQALPGTQGIYGFLTAIMILQKAGLLGGGAGKELPLEAGAALLATSLAIALVGFFSAIYQGSVAAQGVQILAKKPQEVGKAIIMAAMVETYAVLGLLISILSITSLKF